MKTTRNVLIAFFFAFSIGLHSQNIAYKISDIPVGLKENAKAVIRENECTFKIESENRATLTVSLAISVLNKNGLQEAQFVQYYGKFNKIKNISCVVYDENGEVFKKMKNSDILDIGVFDYNTLYNDYRVKAIEPYYLKIPFTVVYSYQIDFDGLLNYPDWKAIGDYNISLEKGYFKVITPKDVSFRYRENNVPDSAIMTSNKNNYEYLWKIQNVKVINEEQYSRPLTDLIPIIRLAPNNFKIDNYPGNAETWKDFGLWNNSLLKGRDALNSETEAKLLELVKDAKNDEEKTRLVYEYFQNKTRYVSVQIGIGGWQPIEANTVDRLGYGDCKALAFYLKTLLDKVGVKSYYTIIHAGNNAEALIKDFPSNQFNHVILCVPMENKKDTIWLESTNQIIPFGYIGTFTDDRDALLIDESGGRIVHTLKYTAQDNIIIRKATVTLMENGQAEANINTSYGGMFYDSHFPLLIGDTKDKENFITSNFSFASFRLNDFQISQCKNSHPSINEECHLSLNGYATMVGDKVLLPANFTNEIEFLPVQIGERKSEIYIRRQFMKADTIVYKIPDSLRIEKVPDNKKIKTIWGEFSAEYIIYPNEICYIRHLSMNEGLFPKTTFNDFLELKKKILLSDSEKIILKKGK